jgi:hypothetical protein
MAYPNNITSPVSVALRLPAVPNVSDISLFQELLELYNSVQLLQSGIDLVSRSTHIADATLTYGQCVGTYLNAGTSHTRLASASATPIPACGICIDYGGTTSGNIGNIAFSGKVPNLTGLTIGAIYYLSDTVAGGMQTTKPVGAGKIVQPIGYAIDATTLWLNPTLLYTQL